MGLANLSAVEHYDITKVERLKEEYFWELSYYQAEGGHTHYLYYAPAQFKDDVPPRKGWMIEPNDPCPECWKKAAKKHWKKAGKKASKPDTSLSNPYCSDACT